MFQMTLLSFYITFRNVIMALIVKILIWTVANVAICEQGNGKNKTHDDITDVAIIGLTRFSKAENCFKLSNSNHVEL